MCDIDEVCYAILTLKSVLRFVRHEEAACAIWQCNGTELAGSVIKVRDTVDIEACNMVFTVYQEFLIT
jgi:hypothetical protein